MRNIITEMSMSFPSGLRVVHNDQMSITLSDKLYISLRSNLTRFVFNLPEVNEVISALQ